MTRFPVNFSGTPAENRRHQPQLGEHSVEVLREAGLSQADIDAMLESGATRQS
jgi:crotonobetainyl-CoA:carnitine CoA-transferase CaiB-like acyl-CoA transferase